MSNRIWQGREHLLAQRQHMAQSCALTAALIVLCMIAPPNASADSTESLRAAVAAVRNSACGSQQSSSVIDQAAEQIGQSTDRWINNQARSAPDTDAIPILKDLGYNGTKARILSGAAQTDGDAIKAALLQGWADLPDCSYNAFGVNALYNAKKNMVLTTIVLAS